MEQQISAVAIAAKDIKALRKFYHDSLGWVIAAENPEVVIFKLGNMMLTLCTPHIFEEYTGTLAATSNEKSVYFTINVDSPKRVNESFKKLVEKNVSITKAPAKTFWGGYSGFFNDPEGNSWEIAYNPISRTKI